MGEHRDSGYKMPDATPVSDEEWAKTAEEWNAVLAPLSIGGGVFDYSYNKEPPVYYWHENEDAKLAAKCGTCPGTEEVQTWVKYWWDGTSDECIPDSDLKELCGQPSHQVFSVGGIDYTFLRRDIACDQSTNPGPFHFFSGKSKNKENKTVVVVLHLSYTIFVAICDEDEGQGPGPLTAALDK